MVHIGHEIRRAREERGLNQTQLAASVGTGPAAISRIENGRQSPNIETLEKIARALELEVRDLFPKAQAPLQLELEEQRGASEERRIRYLRALQTFAATMDKTWTVKVDHDTFSEKEFEEGVNVLSDFENAYVIGIGSDLLGALRTDDVILPAAERESLDTVKANLNAWHRTMWLAYDRLVARPAPNVEHLDKYRARLEKTEEEVRSRSSA
jgi:transcriptional regulator with XRE-family HTH domain